MEIDMIAKRVLAGVLILAGVIISLAGMDSAVQGATCNIHAPIYPAVCFPAGQWPPQPAPLEEMNPEGCVNWYYLWCWPDQNIGCWVEGYGFPEPGVCNHSLLEGETRLCYNNYLETTVMLQYHRAECGFIDGECMCYWVVGEYAPVPAKTCDCAAFN
jgi:hypothetical protein